MSWCYNARSYFGFVLAGVVYYVGETAAGWAGGVYGSWSYGARVPLVELKVSPRSVPFGRWRVVWGGRWLCFVGLVLL